MDREKFLCSIYIVIRNENNEVLLQRRANTKLWCGFLALPAGHVDIGENVYDALIREAKEELNIDVCINDICDTFVVNRRNVELSPYFDVYFEISNYNGEICINEPLKCLELVWCDINNLPNDMITFQKEAIVNYLNGVKFGVTRADENEKIYKK